MLTFGQMGPMSVDQTALPNRRRYYQITPDAALAWRALGLSH